MSKHAISVTFNFMLSSWQKLFKTNTVKLMKKFIFLQWNRHLKIEELLFYANNLHHVSTVLFFCSI